MCQYQTLYHDELAGYVVRCPECEKIQIGYTNLLLTFNTEDFSSFHWWIRKIRSDQHPGQNPTLRCIVIPTPCEGIKLLLSSNELKEFEGMLDAADTELRSLALMDLFISPDN